MKELGLNAVRHRVWVDPSKHGNWCSKEDLLVKCQRAKALDMEILVDFHYSDWWADPAKQNIPASWSGHSYEQMKEDFNELYRLMNGMELQEMDKIIYPVCTLCRDHERAGFIEGVKIGVLLQAELTED